MPIHNYVNIPSEPFPVMEVFKEFIRQSNEQLNNLSQLRTLGGSLEKTLQAKNPAFQEERNKIVNLYKTVLDTNTRFIVDIILKSQDQLAVFVLSANPNQIDPPAVIEQLQQEAKELQERSLKAMQLFNICMDRMGELASMEQPPPLSADLVQLISPSYTPS